MSWEDEFVVIESDEEVESHDVPSYDDDITLPQLNNGAGVQNSIIYEDQSSLRNSSNSRRSQNVRIQNPGITEKVILILGPTGEGKSSLGNFLLGKKGKFRIGHSATSATSIIEYELVNYNGFNIKIVDTPGFLDSADGNDLIEKQMARLKHIFQNVSGIIIAKDSTRVRLNTPAQVVYRKICELYPDYIQTNFCFVITKWSMSQRSIAQRVLKGLQFDNFVKDQCKAMKKCNPTIKLHETQYWFKSDSEYNEKDLLEASEAELDRNNILQWATTRETMKNDVKNLMRKPFKEQINCPFSNAHELLSFTSQHHRRVADSINIALEIDKRPLKRILFKIGPGFDEYVIHYKQNLAGKDQMLLGFRSTYKFSESHAFSEERLLEKSHAALKALSKVFKVRNIRVITNELEKQNLFIHNWKYGKIETGDMHRAICLIHIHFKPVVAAKAANTHGFKLHKSFFQNTKFRKHFNQNCKSSFMHIKKLSKK